MNLLPHRRLEITGAAPFILPPITPGLTPPVLEDLSPTGDVQITPEIENLANQLLFDPVKVFSYVRNNIDFQPYFGSVKGSIGVYWEMAGNDMDQASFLIALLRASNIPSRYVFGVVELPIEDAMEWVGVEEEEVTVEVFTKSGIPAETIRDDGGEIEAIRFNHTWVNAYIPWEGDSAWVQMDPSFKEYEYHEGVDIKEAMGFDFDSFYKSVTQGTAINEAESWFTNLNEVNITTEIENYANNLLNYVQSEMEDATVGDVIGYREIEKDDIDDMEDINDLFPFEDFTPQEEWAKVPDSLRYKIRFLMYGIDYTATTSELYGKRIGIYYRPATPYDQSLIDFFGGIENIPAYLVNMVPLLMIEDNEVAVGNPVMLGSSQTLRPVFYSPTGFIDWFDKVVVTGAWYGLIFNLQRMSVDYFKERLEKLKEEAVNRTVSEDEMKLELIYNNGIGYFMMVDVLSELQAKISRITWTRDPSMAITAHNLVVYYLGGIPYIIKLGGLNIDFKRNILNPTSVTGNTQDEVSWMLSTGSVSSAGEHAIFEALYDLPSVSTKDITGGKQHGYTHLYHR